MFPVVGKVRRPSNQFGLIKLTTATASDDRRGHRPRLLSFRCMVGGIGDRIVRMMPETTQQCMQGQNCCD